jgi:hypothetical protein
MADPSERGDDLIIEAHGTVTNPTSSDGGHAVGVVTPPEEGAPE